ncbi:Alpha/Beta hydrolase protein [Cercophora newfieldiana]|uniref:Alpha/Beta hydrolase protein n=1 Tax=Cercophora newfieldiana TaxID=92897 RepID=A0AA39YSE6_9PEZI|nr:Alpha/Beta hydrolase protein [Cercophora newfieldiana]
MFLSSLPILSLLGPLSTLATPLGLSEQHPILSQDALSSPQGISVPFFASLERLARLVDITYCVGTTGVSPPFSCASRCKDFPSLKLERTWNTGVLLSDSCGYIAVDHGEDRKTRNGGKLNFGPAIIVAFRGTYSITNTIVDLSTIPQEYVPYPAPDGGDGEGERPEHKCTNCTVHMGFMSSWRSAREVVLPALKAARERHPGYPIHLVGHSLGGAVAALASLELRLSMGWTDLTVTTFGEPRVGNKGLANYLDAAFGLKNATADNAEKLPYRRVTHINDPVPLLPLTEWGFRPHAGEVYITKSELQPAPEDLRLCHGDNDPECMGGAESEDWVTWAWGALRGQKEEVDIELEVQESSVVASSFPVRFKLWQLFFAHRDYFWRLGLCVPGGDPADWGRGPYNMSMGALHDDL